MTAINTLNQDIRILSPVTAANDRILKISYTPDAPHFTIRTIISALTNAQSPPFTVSVYKPPSMEERVAAMQASEQRALLLRLISATVIAIPTLIIGVVFMTLLKSNEPMRMYFMQPVWVGNVSRSEWALFIMATPVMFYSANIFHRRAFKEIMALWRKGSPTPILRRFIRFGSMNLLVRFLI
jgi:Cu+-exporting ATPase